MSNQFINGTFLTSDCERLEEFENLRKEIYSPPDESLGFEYISTQVELLA